MSDDKYWCLWCDREIIGDPVYDDDGEVLGHVFIHDDVEHPIDVTYDEEQRPQ